MARALRITATGRSLVHGQPVGFLSPLPPERAAERLDEALNGKRGTVLTPASPRRGDFEGALQGPSFWVQSRGASVNFMERRLHGMFVPCGGSTEVRCELRHRSTVVASLAATVATLLVVTLAAIPLAEGIGDVSLPFGLNSAARVAVYTTLAGLWIVLVGAVALGRAAAKGSDARTVDFVATVLDAPRDSSAPLFG